MGSLFHEIENLAVTVKEHHALLQHFLKDEVLVIVADLKDVAHDQVVDRCLPSGSQLVRLTKVVDFFLGDFSVQDLLVHAGAKIRRDSTLSKLDKEWLVIFGEKAFPDERSLINERLFIVDTDLAHLNV